MESKAPTNYSSEFSDLLPGIFVPEPESFVWPSVGFECPMCHGKGKDGSGKECGFCMGNGRVFYE